MERSRWTDDFFARWAFFSEKKNHIGLSAAYGRMNLFAGWAFFVKKNIMSDGAQHVDG